MERQIVYPEVTLVPHHNLSYQDHERRTVLDYKVEEMKDFTKADACGFARAAGFIETGMSPNEVGLLYDTLELAASRRGPLQIVELGRNFGCSTRMFLQHIIRRGGYLNSWDLKHWGSNGLTVKDSFKAMGFEVKDGEVVDTQKGPSGGEASYFVSANGKEIAHMKIADSVKSQIEPFERWVDYLLIDTEHGLENALGEYMRWRGFLKGGSFIAFHDSELPGPKRAIEMAIEIESDFNGRIERIWKNERVEGFGLEVIEWKG